MQYTLDPTPEITPADLVALEELRGTLLANDLYGPARRALGRMIRQEWVKRGGEPASVDVLRYYDKLKVDGMLGPFS